MALREDQLLGLYIAIPLYFVLLTGAAIWARKRTEQLVNDKVTDQLSAHFLGGQSFGPILTVGTTFASFYSGYTVVGIPNEAYNFGWEALRWLPWFVSLLLGYFGTALRLRKASNIRNHQTPVDFITDRYQSQILRYTIVFLQILPALIFLSVQVAALRNSFNAMFNLPPDAAYPVVIMMIIILLFEWAGGLTSVALTDSVQAVVMIFSFVTLPTVMSIYFSPWSGLDSSTYPKPEFYNTISRSRQLNIWQTSMTLISNFTLPQYVQRIYATANIRNLKISFAALASSVWFTLLPAIYIGTMGVQILGGAAVASPFTSAVASPFTSIIEAIIDLGGFPAAVGYITLTASLAAIMSTADSIVIAISQLITSEIFYPIKPNVSPRAIRWSARFASLIAAAIALLVGIFWKSGITDLTSIQFPLSTQAMPAFLLGLYWKQQTDLHPWCITAGAVFSTIYVIAIILGYIKREANPVPIDAGLTGLAINIVIIALSEACRRLFKLSPPCDDAKKTDAEHHECEQTPALLCPHRPKWDIPQLKRFGEHPLTAGMLWKAMDGVNEPITNPYWVALCVVSISICTPILPENLPPIEFETGIPWWAKKMIYLSLLPFVIFVVAIKNMPTSFPIVSDKQIQKDGIDPNLIELTLREKGVRESYDGPNQLIQSRRHSITETMKEMGIVSMDKGDDKDEHAPERLASQRVLNELLNPTDEPKQVEDLIPEDNDEGGIDDVESNDQNASIAAALG